MNIKFNYLYRDASNFKNYCEVVFSNPNGKSLDEIERLVRDNLIEGCWFIANEWKMPDAHFMNYSWDNQIDHEWHEFESIQETKEETTHEININEFLSRIKLFTNKL
ncbi:MAG: hypothetical protein ABI204_13110 [Ginsengibacter sp.]